ncbi:MULTISPECIES: hypothetical protein [unclassified Kitasatospora]|uniref:hypothetical protein n=1 Tax=unclassified Kitasatospora TaxID=2633591 RepID=UPI003434F5DD
MRRRTTCPVLTAAVAPAFVPLAGCTGVGSDAAAPAVSAPPPPEQAFGPNCAAGGLLLTLRRTRR